jgi:Fe-S-cluster containining protein
MVRRNKNKRGNKFLRPSKRVFNKKADQFKIISQKIETEQRNIFMQELSAGSSDSNIKDLYQLIKNSYESLAEMMKELTLSPPLACKRGCTYCCINQVSLSEPEALFLGFHLLETRSTAQLHELQEKTENLLLSLKNKSRHEIGMNRHLYPCLFLENGTCSIYEARPLVCRGWNSVNADMCRQSNETGNAMAPIENHPLLRVIAESYQRGLMNGGRNMGLETGFLLLPRAVGQLLSGGIDKKIIDYSEKWLGGKPFFAESVQKIITE